MIPKEKTYPVFESNQVLTNAHLNQMLEYLDEQNRLSRANLIGVGIVCGLEVSWDGGISTISISKGCGVSSEGYLAHIGVPGDEPEDCTPVAITDFSTDRYQPYSLPNKPGYKKFHPNCDVSEAQFELWQLVSNTAADYDTATELDEDFLADKVVLLHVELNEEQLKNCSPNSCDDKGSETGCAFVPLLISREDAEKLNVTLDGHDTLPDWGERLGLPDIRMPRLNVPNDKMVTAEGIFQAYSDVLLFNKRGSMFTRIGDAMDEAQTAFFPIVKSVVGNYKFKDKMESWSNAFRNGFKDTSIRYTQYYYDFICDLIQAYDEFRWKGFELMALCCPHEDLFPRHLLLGEVFTAASGDLQIFRHRFRPSMAIAHAETTAEEVRHLFERMVLLIEKFKPEGKNDIRITPSRYGAIPLSKKSIPYYYNDKEGGAPLHLRWDFSKNKIGRAKQNLGYHASDYASDDFVKKPLEYDLEPYNFFRIEGHIGDSWTVSLRKIMKDIKEYRLPFDVVVLNASNEAVEDKDNPWKDRCIDSDLDVIYRIWANEVKCLYKEKIGVLTRPKGKGNLTFAEDLTGKVFGKTAATPRDPFNFFGAGTPATNFVTAGAPAASMGNFLGNSVNFKPASVFRPSTFFAVSNSTPSSSSIFDKVDVSALGIGAAVVNNIDKKEVNTADKLKNNVNKELRQSKEYKVLPVQEYQVVAGHRVNAVADILNVVEELKEKPEKVDYGRLYDKFDLLDTTIADYLGDLEIYNPNDKDATLTEKEVQEMIRELRALQSNCLRNRLEELKKEMEAKKKAVDELIFFSRFATKHPDLRHKSGVPVGGTFVMVFQEKIEGRFGNGGRFRIPEGEVIADFFLPYRCCSDCPPVQFVLPPSRPVFNATSGCPDENDFVFVNINITHGVPPYEIKIDGGEYQLLNGGVELAPGEHTLIVRDAEGGESLPKKVTTKERMTVEADSFDCDANDEMYTARLRIEHGLAPFTLNGQEVAHETSDDNPDVFFITTGQLASGQPATLEIGDSSKCDPISIELTHVCETPTIDPVPDGTSTDSGTPVTLNVLANDSGQDLKATGVKLEDETMGQVTITENGELTYIPSEAAAGQKVIVKYEVTDAQGNTAEGTVTIKVSNKGCDLPGEGLARRCHYRAWIQQPSEEEGYKKYNGEVTKLVINGGLDLTDVVPAFKPGVDELQLDQFHKTMNAYIESVNKAVQEKLPADQKDWWSIKYVHAQNNGYGLLLIEHFTELDFIMQVQGDFQIGSTNTSFTTEYSPFEGTVSTIDRLNLESTSEIPPFNCTELDKCNGKEAQICQPGQTPKLGIEVLKTNQQNNRILVSVKGVDQSNSISRWYWDTGNGISALPNEQSTTITFKKNQGNLQTIRLIGMTKQGCIGMATRVIDLDL